MKIAPTRFIVIIIFNVITDFVYYLVTVWHMHENPFLLFTFGRVINFTIIE